MKLISDKIIIIKNYNLINHNNIQKNKSKTKINDEKLKLVIKKLRKYIRIFKYINKNNENK